MICRFPLSSNRHNVFHANDQLHPLAGKTHKWWRPITHCVPLENARGDYKNTDLEFEFVPFLLR